ncbi:hypothetical protein IscW_ISCW021815 [Ixodes scapularis]|uniref:Transmembrane protein n=1 Tax=Ixodes scapularis TaxID=6945 RepID=B7Q8S5_IXOSC|nr:hypothetical protein IscW_ISCW021815 [Ixodes scapularis]|eukprot:XP_002412424.1 hypothetical protein IscW_ISCW021815 [Ixodes scapularis]
MFRTLVLAPPKPTGKQAPSSPLAFRWLSKEDVEAAARLPACPIEEPTTPEPSEEDQFFEPEPSRWPCIGGIVASVFLLWAIVMVLFQPRTDLEVVLPPQRKTTFVPVPTTAPFLLGTDLTEEDVLTPRTTLVNDLFFSEKLLPVNGSDDPLATWLISEV